MPTAPMNTIIPQIAKLHHVHKTNLLLLCIWKEYEKVLKVQPIAAVDDCFIRTLRDENLGYDNFTALEIITHLFATYGKNSD